MASTCPAFVSQASDALALGYTCQDGGAGVLTGSFDKAGSTFEIGGYLANNLFVEFEGTLAGEPQAFLAGAGQFDAEACPPQSSSDRVECGAVLVDDEDRGHVSFVGVREMRDST